ncbi:MAG: hypothetical protein KDG55_06315 [Rhodocyclaceae bacterium]|nr:hypothetical protein [Rhodocyclaceae bacterium]
MELTVGADNLEGRDLLVLKSTVRLRQEVWRWVSDVRAADLWVIDLSRDLVATPMEMLGAPAVCRLDDAAAAGWESRSLAKPLKANHLMRYIDALLPTLDPARVRVEAPPVAAVTPEPDVPAADAPVVEAEVADAPGLPWAGRRIRLLKAPNLARFPVSVELMGWLDRMGAEAVSFDQLEQRLPLDRDMLRDILTHAARSGHLVDGEGAVIEALPESRRKFAFWKR